MPDMGRPFYHGLVGLFVTVGVLALPAPALASSFGVASWGENEEGQVGDGTTKNIDVPVPVTGLNEATAVAGEGQDSIALLGAGTVVAWGDNNQGQLGDGTTTGPRMCRGFNGSFCSTTPVPVSGLSGVTAIAGGGNQSLALLSNGTVMAWGENKAGQLGDGTTNGSDVPVPVSGLSGVVAIAAGFSHSLALLGNGTVMAWGANSEGQLGDGTTSGSDVPVPVSGLSGVAAIAASGSHSLALLKNGTVMAWGENGRGQLGNGTTGSSDVPVAVSGLSGVTAIAGGYEHSLAVLKNGTVMAWGANYGGQLGDGNEENSDVPVAVSGLTEATAVAAGKAHSLALLKNGTVAAWGRYFLGNGTETGSNVPVAVSAVSGVVGIAAGGSNSLTVGPPLATVSSVEPNYGPAAGGTSVTITGANVGQATRVKFGSAEATGLKVNSGTSITAVSPAGTNGSTVDVTVDTPGGTSPASSSDRFTYGVGVTKLAPSSGPPTGGTSVTITGHGFTGATAVKFGSSEATSFIVESDTTITAVAPAGVGVVDVTVSAPEGTSPTSPVDQFSYAPVVTRVSPDIGGAAGGTSVTITGSNFTGATAVKFGSNEAASFKVESDTTITATAPAGHKTVDVTVTGPGGTSTKSAADEFIYEGECSPSQSEGPVVTSVEPNSGPSAGGNLVEIKGKRFSVLISCEILPTLFESHDYTVQRVMFGSREATSFEEDSEGVITAVAPAGAGTVDVTVETFATSPLSAADQFTYNSPEAPEEPVTGQCNPLVIKAHEAFTVCGTLNPHSSEKLSSAYFAFNEGLTCTGGGVAPAGTEFTVELEGENIYVYGAFAGLRTGTEYTYCLVAKNPSGETFGKPVSFTTTAQPKTEAPASVTSTSAILEGTLEPAGAKLEYAFQYSKGASCQGAGATQSAEGEDKVSAKVEGLTPNTEYTVCLLATKNLAFHDTDTAVGTLQTFKTAESQAEKEAKEAKEAKAKAEAEAAAATKKHQEEETAAARKKNEEEVAAAKKKQAEETAAGGKVSLDGTTLTVHSGKDAAVKLTCTATATCAGKLTLTVKGTAKKGKKPKTETIGAAGFSIPAGKTATVKLKLNATGRALLGDDHGRLSASLTILKSAPAPSQTHTESVHLAQQKATKVKKPKKQ
jgi:alpha-tubulin suppressor-like RCC1 family protein